MQTHMPPSVTATWDYLYNEVIALHYRWIIYRQLFAHSPERIELLHESAAWLFYVLHRTFLVDVQLGISKLADPSRSGKNENLTLETLLKAVENELQDEDSLRADLRGLLDRYHEFSSRIRVRRNKQIAHYDLPTFLDPIDGPSREEIEKALSALRDFMNAIESHFTDATTAYMFFCISPGRGCAGIRFEARAALCGTAEG